MTITKDDTTSFYRAAGIMRDLVRKIPGLTVDIFDVAKMGNLTWSIMCQYDAVFFQRPWNTLKLLTFLKEMKMPIWVDYDDNLFEIPEANNRAWDTFMVEDVHRILLEIAKYADIMTFSTEALAETYRPLAKDVRVIPNALAFDMLGEGHEGTTKQTILWRGGDSHRMDLRFFESEIMQRQNAYKEWQWVYAGYNPWEFTSENKKYRKGEDPVLYFKWLREYGPRVMQVPLVDIHFNRCKSNIAALEGIWAGAVCLGPDWPEWQIPGMLKYKTIEDYGYYLDQICNEKVNFKKYRALGYEYIRDVYDLNKVNELRVQVIKDLMELR